LLGDAVAKCRRARTGYDANTVKLFQMGISMCAFRVNAGDWGTKLTKRQQVFKDFTLDSYKAGDIDFGISDRPVVLPTESERVQLIAQKENLQTEAAMIEAGVDKTLAAAIVKQKREAQEVATF
jgi:hypothetical protein